MPPSVNNRDYSALYIPGAIVLAGLIIGVSLIIAFGGSSSSTGGTPQAPKVNIKDVNLEGDPYIGKDNAPVVMAFWSDYQCPFCKAVEIGHPQIQTPPAIPDLIRDYVDTGKLKIVFKDYPFLGQDSITAALYEHAIWKLYPAKFYEWRVAMLKAQDDEGDQGFGDEASIVALTKKISGIDADKVKADVAANTAEYTAKMDADRAEGTKFGVTGTPGFIVGKTLIGGAVGVAEFTKVIDAEL